LCVFLFTDVKFGLSHWGKRGGGGLGVYENGCLGIYSGLKGQSNKGVEKNK
jgi:hypothetical protein